jgi:hypothetical protein
MSTSITSTSTLRSVFWTDAASPSATDLTKWQTLTAIPTTPTQLASVSVGLFGYDLTNFYMDCATVTTATCTPSNYVTKYTGWALGINFTFKSAMTVAAQGTAGSTVGLCFADTKKCVAVTAPTAAGATNPYGIFSWQSATAPSLTTYPVAWGSITGMT